MSLYREHIEKKFTRSKKWPTVRKNTKLVWSPG
jgi:hypothetical protein